MRGALRSPELENIPFEIQPAFRRNYRLLQQQRCFYGDPQVNLRRSLQIISKFSAQVIILKSNAQIWKTRSSQLVGSAKGVCKTIAKPAISQNTVEHYSEMLIDLNDCRPVLRSLEILSKRPENTLLGLAFPSERRLES